MPPKPSLAFCLFGQQLYIAHSVGNGEALCIDAPLSALEKTLFDALTLIVAQSSEWEKVIIPAGPSAFTSLRILRSVQLGLGMGFGCATPMVNFFDVLFAAGPEETKCCAISTRRGDFFFQKRSNGGVINEGVMRMDQPHKGTLCDDPIYSTLTLHTNLAEILLKEALSPVRELIYGINVDFLTQNKPLTH